MDKLELINYIKESNIIKKWHWFNYNFQLYLNGLESPFAKSIVESCLICESSIPGYAKKFIDDLSQISGIDKDIDEEGALKHYQQLMQRLAELLIIRQVVNYKWPTEAKYFLEPASLTSKKNPEIVIEFETLKIGVEVKAPSIMSHAQQRSTNSIQLPARNTISEIYMGKEKTTLPRDNPVKDFLISADEKFKGFKMQDPNFCGILVIVWDDFVYEPITTLQNVSSGLFTPNSFAKKSDGTPLSFPNIDGVIIVRHLHHFGDAAKGKILSDNRTDAFDFGEDERSLPNIYIANPTNKGVPELLLECLRAYTPNGYMGAEYLPSDLVIWLNPNE